MKRVIINLTILSLVISLIAIPASALTLYPSDNIYGPPLTTCQPLDDSTIEVNQSVNADGDDNSRVTLGPNQYYWFQLWQTRTEDGKWYDYMGSYWNETPNFQVPSLAGRVRPFGNTDLNIGGATTEISWEDEEGYTQFAKTVQTGYYMPWEYVGKDGTITFDFGFYIVDVDHTGNMMPPDGESLGGYFYLFDLKKDGTVKRYGSPVTYEYEYYYKTYTGYFTAQYSINLYEYNFGSNDSLGFIPLFTFYELDTSSLVNKLYFPFFTFDYTLTFQDKLLIQLEKMQNQVLKPLDFNDGGIGVAEENLKNITGDLLDRVSSIYDDTLGSLDFYSDGLSAASTILSSVLTFSPLKRIIYVSIILGAIGFLFGIVPTLGAKPKYSSNSVPHSHSYNKYQNVSQLKLPEKSQSKGG